MVGWWEGRKSRVGSDDGGGRDLVCVRRIGMSWWRGFAPRIAV